MRIRQARSGDIPRILELISQAQRRLAAASVDQWQDGYPNEAVIREDIDQDEGFVVEHNGVVVAYFMLTGHGDEDYNVIEGSWLTDGPYLTLHRLMVADEMLRQGVGSFIFLEVSRWARVNSWSSLRADTHEDNLAMQRTLVSSGFTHCGRVYVRGAEKHPREAYEQVL